MSVVVGVARVTAYACVHNDGAFAFVGQAGAGAQFLQRFSFILKTFGGPVVDEFPRTFKCGDLGDGGVFGAVFVGVDADKAGDSIFVVVPFGAGAGDASVRVNGASVSVDGVFAVAVYGRNSPLAVNVHGVEAVGAQDVSLPDA